MTSRRSLVWSAAAVAAVLAVLIVVLVAAKKPNPTTQLVGRPAPAVENSVETIDGAKVSLSSLRGKHVFLNFFASWCVPCEQEHPQLVAFQHRHALLGDATVVQVIFSDTTDAARRFFERRGGRPEWPVIVDPNGQFALEYGVRAPPETFLIDPDGEVVNFVKGPIDELGMETMLARSRTAQP